MSVTTNSFGTFFTQPATLYTVTNKSGFSVSLTDCGGAIVRVLAPDRAGNAADVCLGFDSAQGYEAQHASIGVLIGRHGNRIEKGSFELNGKSYSLHINNGPNHLHGGKVGFDKKLFKADIAGDNAVTFSYTSADGEEGYPGKLDVSVTYTLDEDNGLQLAYRAVSDADTVCNLTNHVYFNLAGHDAPQTIENHILQINAAQYCQADEDCLANGIVEEVAHTPFDFTQPTVIGERIDSDHPQTRNGAGYDHNFCVGHVGLQAPCCTVTEPNSGRTLRVYTDQPGVQLYTGNHLKGDEVGKGGKVYQKRAGFCLETQKYPNAMKHTHFPSPVLKAGEVYTHTTVYRFGVE